MAASQVRLERRNRESVEEIAARMPDTVVGALFCLHGLDLDEEALPLVEEREEAGNALAQLGRPDQLGLHFRERWRGEG